MKFDSVKYLRDQQKGFAIADPRGIRLGEIADEIERLRAALQYALNFDGEVPELIKIRFERELRAAAFSTATSQSSSGETNAAARVADPLEALGSSDNST